MGYDRKHRHRNRRPRKPLRQLAKRAWRRKSATAQAGQIAKIARHLSHLKKTVKDDTSAPALYSMEFYAPVKTQTTDNYNVIVPLTCGVSQRAEIGQRPHTNLTLPSEFVNGVIGWEPIFQPRDLHPDLSDSASRATVPPWIKVYKQHCRLKFYSGTNYGPVTLTVSVVRLNKDGIIANSKAIAKRCDGPEYSGPEPDPTTAQSYIMESRDFAASPGLSFPQATADPAGGAPTPEFPSPNHNGNTNVLWNRNFWHVEYQKQFTLGSANNPFVTAPATPLPVTATTPSNQAQYVPEHNQFSEECRFDINYGGMRLSTVPPPEDGEAPLELDPMAVTDMAYKNIPPEHKRWLVIQSSDPQIGASVYAPYMQFSSTISTRVPI